MPTSTPPLFLNTETISFKITVITSMGWRTRVARRANNQFQEKQFYYRERAAEEFQFPGAPRGQPRELGAGQVQVGLHNEMFPGMKSSKAPQGMKEDKKSLFQGNLEIISSQKSGEICDLLDRKMGEKKKAVCEGAVPFTAWTSGHSAARWLTIESMRAFNLSTALPVLTGTYQAKWQHIRPVEAAGTLTARTSVLEEALPYMQRKEDSFLVTL